MSARETSAEITAQHDHTLAKPKWAYNHFLMYGQSLAAGQGAWPPKTRAPVDGAYMLGACERPASNSADYHPAGGEVLQPLVGTISGEWNQGFAPDGGSLGESPLVGALHMARHLCVQSGNTFWIERSWIGSNAAIGAKTVKELSKGSMPDYFSRLKNASKRVKNIADRSGKGFGIAGVFFLQGEDDYIKATDPADFKEATRKLQSDVISEVAKGLARQNEPPAVITYQTGGGWAKEGLSIAQAQFELCLDLPGWYLAAPSYPVTNRGKDFHLDANGSRWLGMQLGKVWYKVVVEGKGWRPTSPLQASYCYKTILVSFHVPTPPLQFKPVWASGKPVNFRTKGFSAVDGRGALTITSVEIVADAVVALQCARPIVGAVVVSYGEPSISRGAGNLCDSDATRASANYEYDPDRGDPPEANIKGLVGKPYPLWNWCVAFKMEAFEDSIARTDDMIVRMFIDKHRAEDHVDQVVSTRKLLYIRNKRYYMPVAIGALIVIAACYDAVYSWHGLLTAQSTVPTRYLNGSIVWQKRCIYRFSMLTASRFIDGTSPEADAAEAAKCPDHLD